MNSNIWITAFGEPEKFNPQDQAKLLLNPFFASILQLETPDDQIYKIKFGKKLYDLDETNMPSVVSEDAYNFIKNW